MKKITLLPILPILFVVNSFGQGFPDEMEYNAQEHIIYTGGQNVQGFYEEDKLETIELSFSQSDYWTQLTNNKASGTEIPATLTYKGDTYNDVGVRFKGNTSYNNLNGADKKSFNVTMDFVTAGQDIGGYETFNFNNCFQDESFMREIFYLNAIRNHIPAAKGNYINLYINGQNWGLYPNVQQLNAEFIREWFTNDGGSRWRAISPDFGTGGGGGPGGGGPGGGGPGGGGGGQWGSGLAALNWLGSTQTDYEDNYTLKSSTVTNPWTDLMNTCQILDNTTSANWETTVANTLDVDRALWFLASEILFTDDDGYVYKGTMDYLLYFDIETNRMVPLEFDGNSVMDPNKYDWSPFYNETNVNYPLMNKLFAIPGLRQRYLAHLRTLIEETFEPTIAHSKLDEYATFIDAQVQADPKKLYSYNQFTSGVTELKSFVSDRYNYLMGTAAFSNVGPEISNSSFETEGVLWENPDFDQAVQVKATTTHNDGINAVYLYYATGLEGNFTKSQMYDDGAHNDGAANDGVYGGEIPAFPASSTVRYYIESVADNNTKSASFMPQGAEHNIFVYKVNAIQAAEKFVVINELMAKNKTSVMDEADQYDDWIELYNLSSNTISLDGWSITDNQFNVTKFTIPTGTSIGPNEYIIIWADEDSGQGDLHANFKLSGDGESLILFNANNEEVDKMSFTSQLDDIAYARVPNGTGDFIQQTHTFKGNNDLVSINDIDNSEAQISIYPNPSNTFVTIVVDLVTKGTDMTIVNAMGQTVYQENISSSKTIDVSKWNAGTYFVQTGNTINKFLVL
tara:strand:+ start:4341 stop:6728 length:2388 start_codon:yes stop_codon:yes gene_type:complete